MLKEKSTIDAKTSKEKGEENQDTCMISKYSLQKIFVNEKASPHKFLLIVKGKNSNFVVEYPGQPHFDQVLEVSITSKKTSMSWTLQDDVP